MNWKELLNIQEGDFELSLGVVVIKNPKEKKPKTVPLLAIDLRTTFNFALKSG